jgi:iron complex transport system permease protein
MSRRATYLLCASLLLLICVGLSLSVGRGSMRPLLTLEALLRFDPGNYEHHVVVYQRLPRALIAIHVGALMACGGAVLQTLTTNPLASPSTLGINAGATAFVVAGAYLFGFDLEAQGLAALVGAIVGFLSCLAVARLAGLSRDPRRLSLILSGALMSMLFMGIAHALLLSDPARRSDFLDWITGNINHVYVDRLATFWWIGAGSFAGLLVLSRPLTLIMLGPDKAASAGVPVDTVVRLSLLTVAVGSGSAVAICGPIGFVGIVVPHLVRPLVGAGLGALLPTCALIGASICLLADLCARSLFQPYQLHTGVLLDLLGGLVFALIVKRFYLTRERPA